MGDEMAQCYCVECVGQKESEGGGEDEMNYLAHKTILELRDYVLYGYHGESTPAFDEVARRLKEAQQSNAEVAAKALEELASVGSEGSLGYLHVAYIKAKAAEYRAKAGRKE